MVTQCLVDTQQTLWCHPPGEGQKSVREAASEWLSQRWRVCQSVRLCVAWG